MPFWNSPEPEEPGENDKKKERKEGKGKIMHEEDEHISSYKDRSYFRDNAPRINLERLTDVKERILDGVITEAAREWQSVHRYLESTSVDGWIQGSWRSTVGEGERCQTAYCVAGWTVQLDIEERLITMRLTTKSSENPTASRPMTLAPLTEDMRRSSGDWLVSNETLLYQTLWREEHPYGERPLTARPLADSTLLFAREDDDPDHVSMSAILTINEDGKTATRHEVPSIAAEDRAARLLGLSYDEQEDLFEGDNTLQRVLMLIETYSFEERVRRARHDAIRALAATTPA